jgi:hypothetical protein
MISFVKFVVYQKMNGMEPTLAMMVRWLQLKMWSDPLKLHKSEQSDQSVLRGVGG